MESPKRTLSTLFNLGIYLAHHMVATFLVVLVVGSLLERWAGPGRLGRQISPTFSRNSLILFSLMLSQLFVMEDIPQALVEVIFDITTDKTMLLILVTLFLFAIGMVVNDITAIILTAPLLMPLMGALGVSPIQFAAIMGVTTAMGGVTPPYASILYLGARIGNVKFTEVIKPAMILLLFGYLPVVVMVLIWPEVSEYIPAQLGY